MIWRGIMARRPISLTIFTLTGLVVCGTVVAVAFSRLTNVSLGSAGALILLGLVALTGQSVESVRRREPELALARLHGRRGLRLLVFAIAEPSAVVVAGGVAGVAAGWSVTRLVVSAWLMDGTTASLGRDAWVAAALVTLGSVALVMISTWRILRGPLLEQLTGARRPRPATTVALFFQLILVLGATVSVYQAQRVPANRVDWVTLLSPAVVGLAAGQVLIWLVLALLAFVVPRTRSARVGWFLTTRRLLRRADSLAMIRVVVAAGVVSGVALSAASAAQVWREDQARLRVGAPLSYPVADGALRAYQAAARADPRGEWLLPVAAYTSTNESAVRRVFVETERWRAVVGDFFEGSPSATVTGRLEAFRRGPTVRVATGDHLSATVVSSSLRGTQGLTLTFQYVDDVGDTSIANLTLRPGGGAPAGPDLTRFSARLSRCHFACAVFQIDIAGMTQEPGTQRPPLRLTGATVAGEQLLAASAGIRFAPRQPGLSLVRGKDTLMITATAKDPATSWILGGFRSGTTSPALSTGRFQPEVDHGSPAVQGVDGVARPESIVATVPALPFVGTRGSMLDLGTVLVGSGGSIPATDARILARSNTPPDIIAALRATHSVGRPTTYAHVLERLSQTPRAQGVRLYGLVAAFAGLIALVSIASAVAQQTRERRREAASLRSVGVRARSIAGAHRREALVLAVTTFVGTAIAAWITCRALLPALPLVSGWGYAPPLDAAPNLRSITLSALVAGAVVGAVTVIAFRGVGRSAPPRILREDPL